MRLIILISKITTALVLSFSCISPVTAAVMHTVDVNGQLIGATGIEHNGLIYDVTFVDDSVENLLSSNAPTFQTFTEADAQSFLASMFADVFVDVTINNINHNFDSNFTLTQGCETNQNAFCNIIFPYASLANGRPKIAYIYNVNSDSGSLEASTGHNTLGAHSFSPSSQTNRTGLRVAVSAVPEPSSYAMLLAGLILVTGVRFKQRV